MLKTNIETALNNQIRIEAESSQIYLSMACWAEAQGLEGVAQFMFNQSDEERQHMLKLVKYVNERGSHAKITELKAPKTEFGTFKEMFEECTNMNCLYLILSMNWFTLLWVKKIMLHTTFYNGTWQNKLKRKRKLKPF